MAALGLLAAGALPAPASATPVAPLGSPPPSVSAEPDPDRSPLGQWASPKGAPAPEPTSVVVTLRDGVAGAADVARSVGGRIEGAVGGTESVVISTGGQDAETVAGELRSRPDVRRAEPNGVVAAYRTPDDPEYPSQAAAHDQIRLDAAWRIETGDPSVVVAVLDTGVDADHPDLSSRLVPGWNVLEGNDDTEDDDGHGTLVAGVIAGERDNAVGVAGVAGGGTRIMPVKVLDSEGLGTDADVASGIVWAADHGADVINLSLGRIGSSVTIDDAVSYAQGRDVVVVAATGNHGVNAPTVPAGSPGVVGVGATDTTGQLAWFSTFGAYTDIVAPGMDIRSTELGGGYASVDGTSFAAPMVAGIAALIRARHPGHDELRVRIALLHGAEDRGPPGVDDSYGFGVLDAATALGVLGREPLVGVGTPPVDDVAGDLPVRAATASSADTESIQVEGDVDWWRIDVPEAAVVSVTVTPAAFDPGRAGNFDPVVEAFGVEGRSLGITDLHSTGVAESAQFQSGPGSALVSVENFHGSVSGGDYSLEVTLTPPDPFTWQPPAEVTAGETTGAFFESSPGDVVGSGSTYRYDQSDARFTPSLRVLQGVPGFSVEIDGHEGWELRFLLPDWQTTLEEGRYPYMAHSVSGREALGSLTVDGPAYGCNKLAADMIVDEATVEAGVLQSFELRFEYRCEITGPPLYGWVRWRADDPTAPPGYTEDPGDLWSPDPAQVPASGTAAFFDSDPGGPIGRGEQWLYTQDDAEFTVVPYPQGVGVRIDGFEDWRLDLHAPPHETLRPGLLPEVHSPNPTRSRLALASESVSCGDHAHGWAVVDALESDAQGLRLVEFRFGVRCGHGIEAEERGWVRWERDDPTTPPGYQPVPPGLWAPPDGSVPTEGTVLAFDTSEAIHADPGLHVVTLNEAVITGFVGGHVVEADVRVDGRLEHRVTLYGPDHLPLAEGYLTDVPPRSDQNPTRGMLALRISGLDGCDDGRGWAVVDDLAVGPEGVTSVTFRFEHPCEDPARPVRGFIRLEADVLADAHAPTPGTPGTVDETTVEAPAPRAAAVGDGTAERDGPWLMDATPRPRTRVDPATDPTVTFGRWIRRSTIDDSTVVLLDGVTGAVVPATLSTSVVDSTTSVRIRPDGGLRPGMQYVIGVGGLTDSKGATMPVRWVPFTTAGVSFPHPVAGGDADPLAGDFDGDGHGDVLLYQPGAGPDALLLGSWAGFETTPTSITGSYDPFTVDLNGDGFEDVFWYRSGPGADYIWFGGAAGFSSVGTQVSGSYEPMSLDLNGDGYDDILWYRAGPGADYIWYGGPEGFRSVATRADGTYRPFTLDIDGDGLDDVFWYAPGAAADYLWYGRADGFRSVPTRVNGDYVPVPGDFDGDGYGDITWYRAGSAPDHVWWSSPRGFRSTAVTINGSYRPVAADYNGDGFDDLFLYGPGAGPDYVELGSSSGHL